MAQSKPNHSRKHKMLVDHLILVVPAQMNNEFQRNMHHL